MANLTKHLYSIMPLHRERRRQSLFEVPIEPPYNPNGFEYRGYDTYDAAIVCATSAEEARSFHPGGIDFHTDSYHDSSWVYSPDVVEATIIGTPTEDIRVGIVLSSFRAG